jgi:hypothetical protein
MYTKCPFASNCFFAKKALACDACGTTMRIGGNSADVVTKMLRGRYQGRYIHRACASMWYTASPILWIRTSTRTASPINPLWIRTSTWTASPINLVDQNVYSVSFDFVELRFLSSRSSHRLRGRR